MPLINFYVRQAFETISRTGSTVNIIALPQRAKLKQLAAPNKSITFPFGPQDIQYDSYGLEYATVDRPGTKPLLEATTKKLRHVSITAMIARREDSGRSSIQSTLDTLEAIASDDVDCQFTYGVTTLPYRVRVVSFGYTTVRRDHDGNITQAEAAIELREIINFSQSVVTLDAIQYPPTPIATTDKSTGSPGDPGDDPVDEDNGVNIIVPDAWEGPSQPLFPPIDGKLYY